MIGLPKDAEGLEIPLDTVALFGGNGNVYSIRCWVYTTDFDLGDSTADQWRALTDEGTRLDPELMYLIPPDSWEKLEEDSGRGVTTLSFNDAVCDYFDRGSGYDRCKGCPADKRSSCTVAMLEDIATRIRKLRGEDR